MNGGLNIAAGNQEERWIRFQGLVNVKSGPALMRLVDQCVANGAKKIHLLIHSLGGDIFAGQSAFNYLRMLQVEVATYNIATVQSIAVHLFCAGAERYCLSNATFMIHPVQWQAKSDQILIGKQLREAANFCETHTRNIAEAVAGQIGKQTEEVLADMEATKTFSAAESKAYGFVHEIVTPNFFPVGTAYTVIEEDGSVRDFPGKQRIDPFIENLIAGKSLNLPKIPTFSPTVQPPKNQGSNRVLPQRYVLS